MGKKPHKRKKQHMAASKDGAAPWSISSQAMEALVALESSSGQRDQSTVDPTGGFLVALGSVVIGAVPVQAPGSLVDHPILRLLQQRLPVRCRVCGCYGIHSDVPSVLLSSLSTLQGGEPILGLSFFGSAQVQALQYTTGQSAAPVNLPVVDSLSSRDCPCLRVAVAVPITSAVPELAGESAEQRLRRLAQHCADKATARLHAGYLAIHGRILSDHHLLSSKLEDASGNDGTTHTCGSNQRSVATCRSAESGMQLELLLPWEDHDMDTSLAPEEAACDPKHWTGVQGHIMATSLFQAQQTVGEVRQYLEDDLRASLETRFSLLATSPSEQQTGQGKRDAVVNLPLRGLAPLKWTPDTFITTYEGDRSGTNMHVPTICTPSLALESWPVAEDAGFLVTTGGTEGLEDRQETPNRALHSKPEYVSSFSEAEEDRSKTPDQGGSLPETLRRSRETPWWWWPRKDLRLGCLAILVLLFGILLSSSTSTAAASLPIFQQQQQQRSSSSVFQIEIQSQG